MSTIKEPEPSVHHAAEYQACTPAPCSARVNHRDTPVTNRRGRRYDSNAQETVTTPKYGCATPANTHLCRAGVVPGLLQLLLQHDTRGLGLVQLRRQRDTGVRLLRQRRLRLLHLRHQGPHSVVSAAASGLLRHQRRLQLRDALRQLLGGGYCSSVGCLSLTQLLLQRRYLRGNKPPMRTTQNTGHCNHDIHVADTQDLPHAHKEAHLRTHKKIVPSSPHSYEKKNRTDRPTGKHSHRARADATHT